MCEAASPLQALCSPTAISSPHTPAPWRPIIMASHTGIMQSEKHQIASPCRKGGITRPGVGAPICLKAGISCPRCTTLGRLYVSAHLDRLHNGISPCTVGRLRSGFAVPERSLPVLTAKRDRNHQPRPLTRRCAQSRTVVPERSLPASQPIPGPHTRQHVLSTTTPSATHPPSCAVLRAAA